MRISHTELAACAANPAAWVREKAMAARAGFRRGPNAIVRDAIYRYHTEGQNADAGFLYLEDAISSKGIAGRTADEMRARFASYVEWCTNTGVAVARHRLGLNYDLGNGVFLGGYISRVDVVSSGYRGVLFGADTATEVRVLRMALVQVALAAALQRPVPECAVGFQALDGTNLDVRVYSAQQCRRATELGEGLALIIANEARRLGL